MTRHTTWRTMLWILLWPVLLAWPILMRAHSELVAADPAPGAQLAVAPAEIRLTFSTQLMPGSTFVVWDENFRQVSGIAPQIDPQQPNQLFALLPPLAAGDYTVQWTTVGNDGHTFSGSYAFRTLAVEGADGAIRNWVVAAGAVALVFLIWLMRRTQRYRWLHESFWR